MPTAYCVQEDVLTAGSISRTLTALEISRVASAIVQAQAQLETMLGTFFYQAHLKVVTQAVQSRQTKIFLPAPCISIDSGGVIENGTVLTENTDFLLYQPSNGAGIPTTTGWIEKASGSAGNFGDNGWGPGFWTNVQQGISISGIYGYAAVPAEVTKMTAYLAARLLGWITFSYVEGDGASKASVALALPDWFLNMKRNWVRNQLDEQFFKITVLT